MRCFSGVLNPEWVAGLELSDYYFIRGKAHSPILSPSSTTTPPALLRYFNLSHGLVKEIHYVDELLQVDWLVPFRRAWLHLMCTNCEL